MDGDGDGAGASTSGDDVSSMATDKVPLAVSDPELPLRPQPNASPATGSSENDLAILRQFAHVFSRIPRSPWAPSEAALFGGPNTTGHSAIFLETHDGDRVGYLRRGDVDIDVAAAGTDDDGDDEDDDDDDDDAYDGFGFSYSAVPASGVAIACLPETTVGEGEGEGEERERGECAVCLGEYEAGDALRMMPCAHCFHERCIFEWLSASRLCLLCRFALPPEDEEDTETVFALPPEDEEDTETDDETWSRTYDYEDDKDEAG